MSCYCFLRDIADVQHNCKTAYFNRFNANCLGPAYPFGAAIEYVPISKKDKERVHTFSSKLLSGMFVGYDQRSGGSWSGDLYVIDTEEMESAEHISEVYIKRFNHNEVHVVKIGTKYGHEFMCPCKHCIISQPGKSRTPKQKYIARKHKQASENREPGKDDTCEDDVVDEGKAADGDVEQDF